MDKARSKMGEIDIIVMGNGFDLICGLNSRYSDFAESRESDFETFYLALSGFLEDGSKMIKRGESMTSNYFPSCLDDVIKHLDCRLNIWEIFFAIKNYKDKKVKLWKNIEKDVRDFFSVTRIKQLTSDDLFSDLRSDLDFAKMFGKRLDYGDFIGYAFSLLCLGLMSNCTTNENVSHEVSKGLFQESINNASTDIFGRFLLNELNRFEKDFCEYIFDQVKSNKYYNLNANNLVYALKRQDNDFNSDSSSVNRINYFLNFNYTIPDFKQENKYGANVHGYIGDEPNAKDASVIIGIDQEKIDKKASYAYIFTKTYRKLFLRPTAIYQPLPPKSEVRSIIFYGHSLGEADYSYFRSIFDFYDIESSTIELVFNYSIFDNDLRYEISQNQYRDVYNLITNYSNNTNKASGMNLIHRLLLESRIKIVELSDFRPIKTET